MPPTPMSTPSRSRRELVVRSRLRRCGRTLTAPRAALAVAFALLASAGGCTSYYLIGAAPHEGVPPGAWTYRLGTCERTANKGGQGDGADKGPAVGPQGLTWYVVTGDRGLVLVEIENSTRGGNEVRNRWSDAEGDHFFAYEQDKAGYLYDIPAERGQPGRRSVFAPGTYQVSTVDGKLRPQGQPESSCALQPEL